MKLGSAKKLLLLALTLLFVLNLFLYNIVSSEKEGILEVSFLDVGQGDSILIKTPTDRYALIDGGDGAEIIKSLSSVLPFSQREIDLVIATHPDKDHIGGLVPIFDLYEVRHFLYSDVEKDSALSKVLLEKVFKENSAVTRARRGILFDLGGGAYLETLFPDRNVSGLESNTASVINRLVYGQKSFLFTGDAPKSIEKYLKFLDGDSLASNILKVGHHGSKTSTAPEFLAVVTPDFGVLSFGKDNRYGHPHQEVLETMNSFSVEGISTAGEGDIVFSTDGQNLLYERK